MLHDKRDEHMEREKRKKRLAIIILVSICMLFLVACKTNGEKEEKQQPSNNTPTVTAAPEERSEITPTAVPAETITPEGGSSEVMASPPPVSFIVPEGQTIKERFALPTGFTRVIPEENSFAEYLQNLPLKPDGAKVRYYDGREKSREVYLGVVDFTLGERDLQQCADAVMRLRAEYLYEKERYNEIHFNFVSGFRAEFSKWSSGNGVSVNGNSVSWYPNSNNNSSYESFQKYLDIVYAYASTLSLEKELQEKPFSELEIGDVFIQGGSPGHCVIVVDVAMNEETGEKVFMLAQSYMPAQDIQVLIGDEENSPWFSDRIEEILYTPEWRFHTTDLKTWDTE